MQKDLVDDRYRGQDPVKEVFIYKNGSVRAEFYFAASEECISFQDLPNAFSTCCYAFTSSKWPDQVRECISLDFWSVKRLLIRSEWWADQRTRR